MSATQQTSSEAQSDNNSDSDNSNGRPERQVARRVLAEEWEQTNEVIQADAEQAPRYAVLPTGQYANRLFIVGTLTEVVDVGKSSTYLQVRIAAPTGVFRVYAGEYQPDALSFLENVEPPLYVAVQAKPGQPYEDDDGNQRLPLTIDTINEVDGEERQRWTLDTASETQARVAAFDPDEPSEPAPAADQTTHPDLAPDPDLEGIATAAQTAFADVAADVRAE
jgi:RPA family protein